MTEALKGFKVAILVANGFEQSEMTVPKKALEEAGASIFIISPADMQVEGWESHKPNDKFKVDVPLKNANPNGYEGLLLPGGLYSPDALRKDEKAIAFVKGFKDKPIAAICHGPWLLINAQLVRDKNVTSYPSIKIDLINAGAKWVDKEMVRDGNLVTSRSPSDLPAFCKGMIGLFSEAFAHKK